MELLKKHKLPFGISTCYTSVNYKDIASDEFFDLMMNISAILLVLPLYASREMGCKNCFNTRRQRAYVIIR